ncbi:MAG: cell surface protein [Phycisphaerae bacterium]|nr:cell surface protein [Phycisphaerae bacterium]
MRNRWVWLVAVVTVMVLAAGARAESYRGPAAVVVSADGARLFVANADANEIAIVDVERGVVTGTIAMPALPTGLVLSPDGITLYVTCASPRGTVQCIDVRSGQLRGAIGVGHTPTGPAVNRDGTRLYVCNRYDGDVSVIDAVGQRELARVPVTREPIAAAIAPDGRTVFVANHLPADPSDADDVAATVTAIDAQTHATVTIRLPNGSSSVCGLCISPDGKHVYATHILARYHLPTTQVERGWMNTNALSVLDAAAKTWIDTVLLDEVNRGAANPWGVTTTAEGGRIVVTHAGTNELSVIDAPALMAKLAVRAAESVAERPYDGNRGAGTGVAVRDDLTFLAGLRRRVALAGVGPRGVAVIGDRAYVCEYFTDTLGVVALDAAMAGPVARIALGSPPTLSPTRRGEMLFNSADLCFQQWQSCASCHPDGRADGLNWDLINDGLGNPKNARSMLLAHPTPPAMASGVRPTAEAAVRAGIHFIQFTERPEADAAAIDMYLQAVEPVPSPHRVDGQLSDAAKRGERLFNDPKIGCATCHLAPLYTDLKEYDVGSRTAADRRDTFDTPTLIECWRTAPYMHDGHYTTLRELLEKGRHGATHGALDTLTSEQIADLVAFVLSL